MSPLYLSITIQFYLESSSHFDISLNYKQLLEENRFEKTKILSSVISGSRGLVGHEYRINFVKLLDNLSYYDNYGRGCPFPNIFEVSHSRGP